MVFFLSLLACTRLVDAPQVAAPVARTEAVAGLEVLFCPDDNTEGAELLEIQRVIEARLADPQVYEAGNPYQIHYAVYNLRNQALVDGLVAAREAGVQVQILTEADQLSPSRDWNWADEYLIARGFSFAPSHRDLSEAELQSTELIGVTGGGLMHLKTRLFTTPEGTVLVTGSMNPGDNATLNEETWHRVTEGHIVDQYLRAYQAVLHDEDFDNQWVEGAALNVLFSPERSGEAASTRLLDWISEEDEQILLMVYSLREISAPGTERTLLELLGSKVAQGVPVVLITDRKQSDAYGDPTEDTLRDLGVHVYEATNSATPYTAMHHKVAVLGRTQIRVITDAANWSKSGLGSATSPSTNIESTLFIEAGHNEGRTGRRYLAQWMRVLSRYAAQSEAEGEPSYEAMAGELLAATGWPTERVMFTAHEATTEWGETLGVVGNSPALGSWGEAGFVPLWTDAELYPTWLPERGVDLPVGTRFEWKLIAERDGALRWEVGENRQGFVQSAPAQVDDLLVVEGSFR